ncbi:Lecithin:cholesterol/phospholipid:diacylglycerol acyltransferase [Halteromyces radiatus]|uniref:Lecithin:cholesterol/phospholipid:diacylglycerol acyltransferase n=1 Tax=Halteromyces radiatus TaxID=101107 RepID=UPI00221ED9C6|nr:Lecithin:cholesterol/phospholipid:diacylglycerol acyltransferase [Halteromyces radiatus]KAI8076898.1 Lecithin:cholesterol/phospholipid:diacylglycerol acyltransferase [Halteromyces radiatus]
MVNNLYSSDYSHLPRIGSAGRTGLFSKISSVYKLSSDQEPDEDRFLPASILKDEYQLKAHFPVVMIPGLTASAIESWGTTGKSKPYYRKKIFGSIDMFRLLLSDRSTWIELMKLDPITGQDPPDIKLRATTGLSASDYLFPGFWVWGKVIENLSVIGYDTSNMHMAGYDWRLSLRALEERDQYFSQLKELIERNKKHTGRKTILMSHSMGTSVVNYFLKWAEWSEGGQGGDQWTENHIESLLNINGGVLGVPKALTFMLTGENHDIVSLGKFANTLVDRLLCRGERIDMTRNWSGLAAVLPKGGDIIWGNDTSAPDDEMDDPSLQTFGNIISFSSDKLTNKDANSSFVDDSHHPLLLNHTMDMAMNLLKNSSSQQFNDMLQNNYSFGISTSKQQLQENDNIPRTWSNPLESRLPKAPSMKIYCLYGVGIPTERTYFYSPTGTDSTTDEEDNTSGVCRVRNAVMDNTGISRSVPLTIDVSISDATHRIKGGIRKTDGDRTVPIISNGYMCAPSGGWTKHADLYNPGLTQIIAREYKNEEGMSRGDLRGGTKVARHVDILGNHDLLLDILQIVSNHGENVTRRIFSNIDQIAQRVQLDHLD